MGRRLCTQGWLRPKRCCCFFTGAHTLRWTGAETQPPVPAAWVRAPGLTQKHSAHLACLQLRGMTCADPFCAYIEPVPETLQLSILWGRAPLSSRLALYLCSWPLLRAT